MREGAAEECVLVGGGGGAPLSLFLSSIAFPALPSFPLLAVDCSHHMLLPLYMHIPCMRMVWTAAARVSTLLFQLQLLSNRLHSMYVMWSHVCKNGKIGELHSAVPTVD